VKVSVLMAVYNGEEYLPTAIDSILAQTFPNFELVIVEDGSTDSTPTILARYAAQDARIKIVPNAQNIGLTRSLNRGLAACSGELIARQDADDVSLPYRLVEQVEYMDAHPQTALLSGDIEIIDPNGTPIYTRHHAAAPAVIRWRMLFYNAVGGHSQVMFRREDARALGGYAENRRYSQDYDLWLRLMERGEVVILPRVWLQFRHHTASISNQKRAEQERISLEDSQTAQAALLGEHLPLERVQALRGFFLEPFPPVNQAGTVHRDLSRLYRAFPLRGRGVRRTLAARFRAWARSVSGRRRPPQKLRLWAYACWWGAR